MAKAPTLSDVSNIYTATPIINANNDLVEAAFENTLSLDGSTPNNMAADIDLNSNDLLNVNTLNAERVVVKGVDIDGTVVIRDLDTLLFTSFESAEASTVPDGSIFVWIEFDDLVLGFQQDDAGTCWVDAAGKAFSPMKSLPAFLQHWKIETHDSKELARSTVTGMSTAAQALHQTSIVNAYANAAGQLITNGWVEALDEVVVGEKCVPELLDGVAGETLSGGLFITSRYNLAADSVVTAGVTGTNSYSPYVKSLSIALDQSAAETAAQAAYNSAYDVAYGVAYASAISGGSTIPEAVAAGIVAGVPAGLAVSDAAFAGDIIDYPRPFVGKEAFGVLDSLQVTGSTQPVSFEGPDFVDGSGNPDNVGGWEVKKLQIGGTGQDLLLDNGFHFFDVGIVDLWVYGLGPREQQYRNREITTGVRREAMYVGRLDSFRADHIGIFQGGQIVFDKGEGNSITDHIGSLQLDGDYSSLTLRSGRTTFSRVYGSEDVATPVLGDKILCEEGTHSVSSLSLVGDAQALTRVAGGSLRIGGGVVRNTNINGHGGVVTAGQLIYDGVHFVVGIDRAENPYDYADWNVGYIEQSGTGELVVTASCTAEQYTAGGVVQGPSVQTWLAVKVTANNPGCNIEPSPRTRAEMVLALSGVDYCLFPIKGSRVYSLDGLRYIGNSSTSIIPDLLGLLPLDDYSPTHFGWTSAQDATTQTAKVQSVYDALRLIGGTVRITRGVYTLVAPYRAVDGIYAGWVANDEMRRANKAIIIYSAKNITTCFDEGAVIDRSGDQIADTDYAVYSTTFYVSKSENIWFHNPQIIGYQDDAALLADNKDQTSGDAIQFNSGCDYVGIIGGHLKDGTSGVTVGYNRTAAEASFDPALAPVTNFRIIDTLLEGFEHKALLSDVDGFEVDIVGQGWTRANASVSETQRGVYLEGCKNGTVKAHLWDVFKTSLLVGNKGVENVDVDLWVHSMKTNDAWVADTGGNLDTVYNGVAAAFATETAKNVTVNIHKARSATTVTMSEVGHKDITLNLGDCHAAFAGVRTLTQITDQTALVDNPITGLKLTGQVLVDATLTGYSGLTPNTGLLLNSAAVDGSGDPVFGEVLLDNLSVKSTNRNARVLNFNGAVNGGEFLQTRGQASARSYDFNYNGDINFTGQTIISDDREFNGPSDGSTLISNVVQFFTTMKAKLWSLPYNGQNGLAPIGSARTGRQMHRLAGKMQMVSPHQNQQDSLAHYEVEVVPATGATGVETETRVISFNISGKDLPDAGHSIRGIRGEAIGDGGSAKVRSVRTNSYGVNGHDGLLVGHMISSERRGLIPTSLGGNGTTDVFADAVAGPFGTEDAAVIGQVGPGVRHVFLAQGATGPTRPQYVFAQSGGNAAILPELATVLSHGGGNGDAWHHYDDAAFTTLLAKMENDGSIVTPRTRAKDTAVVIADETTHSITVPSSTGFMRLWSEGSSDRYFSIHFRATSSPSFAEIVKGSVVELFNTVNTGTDGNMVVNVLDGVVTVRNRAGASININWVFDA